MPTLLSKSLNFSDAQPQQLKDLSACWSWSEVLNVIFFFLPICREWNTWELARMGFLKLTPVTSQPLDSWQQSEYLHQFDAMPKTLRFGLQIVYHFPKCNDLNENDALYNMGIVLVTVNLQKAKIGNLWLAHHECHQYYCELC